MDTCSCCPGLRVLTRGYQCPWRGGLTMDQSRCCRGRQPLTDLAREDPTAAHWACRARGVRGTVPLASALCAQQGSVDASESQWLRVPSAPSRALWMRLNASSCLASLGRGWRPRRLTPHVLLLRSWDDRAQLADRARRQNVRARPPTRP